MKYIKPTEKTKKTLERIRKAIREENISYGEIVELQCLAKYISPEDVELREWANIPEDEIYI